VARAELMVRAALISKSGTSPAPNKSDKRSSMFLELNKTFFELREIINKNAIDILGDFGEACREEFRSLRM
jgi:hypothetical protein